MIKATHHPFFVWFFRLYSKLMIHTHFRKVFIENNTNTPDTSLLIVSNHFSWWDGFFINYLNNRLWHKKFHAMMLEEQLASRKFLAKAGCFSIRRDRSSTHESIRYAQKLLQSPNNLLLIYPQGKIHSQMERPLKFESGAEHLLENTNTTVKMVVVLTDYFEFKKPSVSFYIKNFDPEIQSEPNLNKAFNNFLDECIKKQNIKAAAT